MIVVRNDPAQGAPTWLSRAEIQDVQNALLREVVQRSFERVPFFRRRWADAGVDPSQIRGLADLARLPITRKQDIEADLRENPPFGSYQGNFAAIRLQASSGSTGKPKPFLHTRNDWENITTLWARRLAAQGVTAADRVQVAFAFALFIPSFTSAEGAMKLGALVIPTSNGAVTPSLRQLELARDWGTTVLGTTGGYAMHLAEVAKHSRRRAKVLVVISDGLPTECSTAALKSLVERLEKREHMVVAQVAVRPLEEQCFRYYVRLDEGDLNQVVRAFGEIVARLVKKALH